MKKLHHKRGTTRLDINGRYRCTLVSLLAVQIVVNAKGMLDSAKFTMPAVLLYMLLLQAYEAASSRAYDKVLSGSQTKCEEYPDPEICNKGGDFEQ